MHTLHLYLFILSNNCSMRCRSHFFESVIGLPVFGCFFSVKRIKGNVVPCMMSSCRLDWTQSKVSPRIDFLPYWEASSWTWRSTVWISASSIETILPYCPLYGPIIQPFNYSTVRTQRFNVATGVDIKDLVVM